MWGEKTLILSRKIHQALFPPLNRQSHPWQPSAAFKTHLDSNLFNAGTSA